MIGPAACRRTVRKGSAFPENHYLSSRDLSSRGCASLIGGVASKAEKVGLPARPGLTALCGGKPQRRES